MISLGGWLRFLIQFDAMRFDAFGEGRQGKACIYGWLNFFIQGVACMHNPALFLWV